MRCRRTARICRDPEGQSRSEEALPRIDMELTVQNMYGLLIRSKLLSLDEARTLFARWQEEARESAANVSRFSSWIVSNRYVTEYQASLLARGHADGFFLGEYKILERIGQGRMAGVYKGQHPLGQIVAIKVLPPSKARDEKLLNRFQREARLLLKLKHPNIVRAFQVGQSPQQNGETLQYLVMEYLEGETLEEVFQRRGKLPPAEAVRLIYQALQGLQHIHSHELIHRDLKPANMMLIGTSTDSTLRATVKLLDLGLGRELFDPDNQTDEGLTSEGAILGTPDYMAPEQARNARGADIRADIYSLGCVLYQLLAGQIPFPDRNLINQMIRHATEAPRPLNEFNPAVPDGLQQIINWMMAKDPSQRYPTPERAAQALQVFLAAGAPEVLATPEADPKMRPYLTWLAGRTDPDDPASTLPPEPVAVPLAVPLAASKQVTTVNPPPPASRPTTVSPPSSPPRKPASGSLPVPGASKPERVEKPAKVRTPPPKEKLKKPPTPPLPAALAPSEENQAAETLDVELLPGEAETSARDPFNLRLDRRDLVVFGVGILAGGLAVGIGCWMAVRKKKPLEAEAEEK